MRSAFLMVSLHNLRKWLHLQYQNSCYEPYLDFLRGVHLVPLHNFYQSNDLCCQMKSTCLGCHQKLPSCNGRLARADLPEEEASQICFATRYGVNTSLSKSTTWEVSAVVLRRDSNLPLVIPWTTVVVGYLVEWYSAIQLHSGGLLMLKWLVIKWPSQAG